MTNTIRGKYTYQEIMSQGKVWAETLASFDVQAGGLSRWLNQKHEEVIFTGCGSTYYLAIAAASIWQAVTGERARPVPASELWLFPRTVLSTKPALLAAISRSAETTETLRATDVYHRQSGLEYLSISCYSDRALSLKTPYRLIAETAVEDSIAQTRAFTSLLLLCQAAAGYAAKRPEYRANLNLLPEAIDRLIQQYEPLARQLGEDRSLERFVFLGTGANYGLASEAMLKMKEMSLSPSEAFHTLEFRHGPKSVVAPDTLIAGLISDEAADQEIKVLTEMQQLGASTLAIAETGREVSNASYVLELHSGLPDIDRGPLPLPILQLMAYYRSLSKGLNPDQPENLDAVVKF